MLQGSRVVIRELARDGQIVGRNVSPPCQNDGPDLADCRRVEIHSPLGADSHDAVPLGPLVFPGKKNCQRLRINVGGEEERNDII